MGLIWLKKPVLWHSSRVPSGYDYDAMTDEQKLLIVTRWHDWYTADWDYGQTTLAFFCAAILASAIINRFAWFRARSAISENGKAGPRFVDKLTAAFRYTGARQFHLRATNWYAPPLAAILGVAGMLVFITGVISSRFHFLMLAVRPFYWPSEEMGHSPPIATRAGWISIAIMPFMIAFATKVNFIGLLTGTSHEKLQVFHRWSALFMWVTSLVHTFPFIINDIMMGEMVSSYKTSPWYWTGVAALVPQTYLIALSWGIFRNPYYEIFKKLHFIASGIFMAALFIHVNFRLTSWDYFWATAAIYAVAWLARVVRTLYITGLGLPATIESAGPALIKLTVRAPARLSWTPGQHVFVRVLGLGVHTLTSHPFTVSSLRASGAAELVLRVHGGLTRALAARVAAAPAGWATRVVLDGPYGGLHVPLAAYERVYLLAGGTGATFTLPLFADLAEKLKAGGIACQRVEFVIAVPDSDTYEWMEPTVTAAAAQLPLAAVGVRVHFTRVEAAKGSDASVDVVHERPVLADIVREAHASASKVAIIACGPDAFLYDVRNAVAEAQLVIADGFGRCKDLFLHTETYRPSYMEKF
ncbi:FAD-binding domain-containing protein [Mycena rosella]|uniref:ferric-chelate reductase (NADPH) n=1 Tax=Mycena rosella TaxID=1033263 RepID=A0AAD7GEA9_MYCRO|nr:FAD-binding domain-containing protein [Mycena rosella]